MKLAGYAKLCSGFEASYRSKADGVGADQVRIQLWWLEEEDKISPGISLKFCKGCQYQ